MSSQESSPRFTVCICTRNRADELRKAIDSVLGSAYPIHQLVVSDDSTDTDTRNMITEHFPQITFVAGARRGLGANRNTAIRAATGSHILFIDDDVLLASDFFSHISNFLKAHPDRTDRLIITGTELNEGRIIYPHQQNFLGFQAVAYDPGDRMYSIVINATVFPRSVFDMLRFDENLTYGYEEIDFAARAVLRHHFRITLVPDATNRHFPSLVNRDFYLPFTEASRIYVTFKKYWWMERQRFKAICFLLIAYPHNLAFNLRRRGLAGLGMFGTTVSRSVRYIRACFTTPLMYV